MYDPVIALFISADSVDQDWYDPQSLNRYAYCRNNPLKYTDPSGHTTVGEAIDENAMKAASEGRSAALYGWSFAKAAWSGFGAESVSKVADNLATSRSDATAGDYAGAAIDVVTLGKGGGAVIAGKKLGEKFGGKLLSKAKGLLKAPKKGGGVADDIAGWLGKDAKVISNKAGDKVFLSKEGTKRLRFDIKNPHPHKSPHGHVEISKNGKWKKSGPIYPKDVPKN